MSLIHWWPLNGNTNDYGVNSLALINNGATINSNGKIGSCYYFDGNTSYLQATIEAGLFDGTGHPFSFTFWIKFTDELADRKIIFGDYSLANPYFNIEMSYGSSSYSGRIRFCWSNGCDYWFTVATGIKDTWQHYAITYDGINKISLYKDGTFIESATATLNAASSGTYYIGRDGRTGSTALKGYLNDFRIYNHALSAKEVKEISKGLVLHYNFEDEYIESTTNLGNTSSNYSNMNKGIAYSASGWGGDAGTVTFYANGGYNNYPYKVYHKTATGTGGIYYKTDNDITIEAGKTYTMSVYIKASVNISNASAYGFNINRGSDNNYINYGASFNITTEWQRFTKTFTATSSQAGSYGEMSIIYDDTVTDYYIYYSGFQIEEKDHATPYVNGTRSTRKVYDNSGYGYNSTAAENLQLTTDSISGQHSVVLNGSSTKITTPFTCQNFGNDFTVSAWLKSNVNSGGYLTAVGNETSTSGIVFAELAATNRLQCYINASNGGDINICSYTSFAANTWYYVVYTVKNALSFPEANLYINGALVSTVTGTSAFNETTEPLYIGCNKSYRFWNGLMSDFKIYATVLSAEDILAEYNRKAAIDKNGNLFTGEIIETTYNLLTSENLLNGRVKTNATSNVGEIVTRNNYSAYRISPVPYWSGDGATSKNICKGQFGPGQYIFDLWIDVDEVYYDGNGHWVPGGFEVYYTDGSVENVIIDANSTQGHSGYQHLIRKTNANKTISGLGVYYYIGVPVYIRCDSVICKVNSDGKICKNNIIAGGQFVEPAVSDSKCKLTRYGVASNAIKEL